MLIVSAFFAGIVGVLSLINVELVLAESVGLARSTSALVATVIGGAQSFFGLMAGSGAADVFQRRGGEYFERLPMFLACFSCGSW